MTAPVQQRPADPRTAQAAAAQQVYAAQQEQLRAQLAAALLAVWAGIATAQNFNPAAAARFVSSILPLSLGAQRVMSAITVAQMNQLVAPPRPIYIAPALVTGAALRNNGTAPPAAPRPPAARPPADQPSLSERWRRRERPVDPQDYYQRPIREVKWRLAQGKSLGEALDAGRRRAESIVLTDLQLAHTHTAREYIRRAAQAPPGPRGTIVGFRRVLSNRPNHCALCILASTQRYHREDLLPIHPGCVVEGTRVSADDVAVATRRWYEGPVVVLRTAAGQELTVTPNHPVLTDRGWVPAQFLREGDHVARRVASQRPVNRGPYENEAPALVEDVWRSVSVAGFDRVPLAPEHFHSDGGNGEVHVVWTDGHFASIGDVHFAQHLSEAFLMGGYGTPTTDLLDRVGTSNTLLKSRLSPASRDVRLERLLLPFLGRGLFTAESPGGLPSSYSYAGVYQQSADRFAGDTVSLAEREHGLPVFVLSNDLTTWQLTPGVAAERLDAPSAEFSGEGRALHAERGRRLLDRLAAEVALDRLVLVDHRDFASGHVYNLQTGEGHYTANGLIVSNCGCTVRPILSTEGRSPQVIDPQLAEQVHEVVGRDLGPSYVDPGGRLGDAHYRNIIITNDHGELGPVLGVRGQHFERDPGRPGRLGNNRINPRPDEPDAVDLDAL